MGTDGSLVGQTYIERQKLEMALISGLPPLETAVMERTAVSRPITVYNRSPTTARINKVWSTVYITYGTPYTKRRIVYEETSVVILVMLIQYVMRGQKKCG